MERSTSNPKSTPTPIPRRNLPNHVSFEQWNILAALADTVIPSLVATRGNKLLQHSVSSDVLEASSRRIQDLVANGDSKDLVAEYLGESLTSAPQFKEDLLDLVNNRMNQEARKNLLFILTVLG